MVSHAPRGAEVTSSGYRQELRRTLTFADLVNYGLVYMVPIAPMGIFGSVFVASGGQPALAYAIGLAAMLFTAASYGVLVQAYPSAGSVYTYAGRAITPWVGFLAGWALLLDYVLVPGLLSQIAGGSTHAVIGWLPVGAWIGVFVAVNTVLNLLGIKATRLALKIFIWAELIVLAIFIVAAVAAVASGAGRGFSFELVYTSSQFHVGVLASAASVATLSFLGYDAMSTLAEDAKGGAKQVSTAMPVALALVGLLFIAQSFIAALLVEDPARLIAAGDPDGTAFFDTARVAAGPWLHTVTALATALAWGVANNMVAQVGTSRLLYAMARDGQLPRWLAKVSVTRSVPTNGIWFTAAVSLALGLYMASRDDGITLMTSMVTFGAVLSFIVVNLSNVVRRIRVGSPAGGIVRTIGLPVLGAAILIGIAVNANVLAQRVGIAWMVLGVVVLLVMTAMGRRPRLAGLDTTDDDVVAGRRA